MCRQSLYCYLLPVTLPLQTWNALCLWVCASVHQSQTIICKRKLYSHLNFFPVLLWCVQTELYSLATSFLPFLHYHNYTTNTICACNQRRRVKQFQILLNIFCFIALKGITSVASHRKPMIKIQPRLFFLFVTSAIVRLDWSDVIMKCSVSIWQIRDVIEGYSKDLRQYNPDYFRLLFCISTNRFWS